MDYKEQYKKMLLGLGLDSKDGHKRITKGENSYLFGGSKTTHSQMQETTIKINEQLKKKNKTLDEVSEKEFKDIAHKIGLQKIEKTRPDKKRF